MTVLSPPAPVAAAPAWYDDLCSCLQMSPGCVFQSYQWDPVQALASGWRYRAPDAPVVPVEYYHPAGDALAEQFCLYHPVRLTWHRPADATEARDGVREALAHGRHPIVAVNNFHLPFRPAYHDVHAAHLVLVLGVDDARGEVELHDPMPPAFRGTIPQQVLDRARDSLAVEDESDPFFAGARPAGRWLEIAVEGRQPELSASWLRTVLRANLAELRRDDAGPAALAGLLRRLPDGPADEPGRLAWRDVYVLGWPAQAEASLHARFLGTAARRSGRPELAELARRVDSVAHAWTGFRVAAAHREKQLGTPAGRVHALGESLLYRWQDCLRRYQQIVEDL